ncbi:MAG: hypothetical protein VXZ19_00390 [Pseudomonadota bacterium]|nr:hypothetical protein [Pseudomonadota bacterium]
MRKALLCTAGIASGSDALTLPSASSVYSWTHEVSLSPFENKQEKADAHDLPDVRGTWTNAEQNVIVTSFLNNVLDDVAVLQVLRDGDAEIIHQSAGAPSPRL